MSETVGRYLVEGEIGRGASGTVYIARDPELLRKVAIKELSPALVMDPTFLERFRAEARTMAHLDHPNCVKVYDLIETPGRAFLISEYIRGASLRKVVEGAGSLTPEQSLGVLKGALSGLGHAHALGLVHRDVKPENVLADEEGVSKLADFGQAVFVVGPGAAGGMAAGTPSYMSPEQVTGAPVDYRSDLYSCGAMLFELLTGRPPYVASSPLALMRMHVSDPVPDPRSYNSNLAEGVAGMVMRALAQDSAARHKSAQHFLSALEAAAAAGYGVDWEKRSSIKKLVATAMEGLGLLALGGAAGAL